MKILRQPDIFRCRSDVCGCGLVHVERGVFEDVPRDWNMLLGELLLAMAQDQENQ